MPLSEIYVKLIVGFPRDPKVRALVRYGADAGYARDLYVQMVLHCKENLTDGFVPVEEIGLLVYPLPPDHGNQLAKQLASVGLIKEVSNGESQGWLVLAYLKRNGSKKDVERLSRVRAEAGKRGGRPPRKPAGQEPVKATQNQVGLQTESRPNPYTETDTDTTVGSNEPTENHLAGDAGPDDGLFPAAPLKAGDRPDVDKLCAALVDAMVTLNECKRPRITETWRKEARLLLDTGGKDDTPIPLDKALALVEWCQRHHWWRSRIQSMKKFRADYDAMRLQAITDWERQHPGNGNGNGGKPARQSTTDTRVADAQALKARRRARQGGQAPGADDGAPDGPAEAIQGEVLSA